MQVTQKSPCHGEVKKRKGPHRYGACTRKSKRQVQSRISSIIFNFCESCAKRYEEGREV